MCFSGWINFFISKVTDRFYFPLRSYFVLFNRNEVLNSNELPKSFFNFAGFNVIIKTLIPYKIIDDIIFVFICIFLVVLFFIGYKIVQASNVNNEQIVKWSIIFSILIAFSIPSHSSDLYGYIARGAQQSLYNQNPYLQTVTEINSYSTHPLFLNFMWPSQPTTYGPVFIYITKAIVYLSNSKFFLSFINFKLLNLTIFFFLILIALRFSESKDTYLIAWNPLILVQGLWNCHNDLFSGILIFVGLYLLLKENYFWSVFSLTLATGVKYVALLTLPLILFYLVRSKPHRLIFINVVLGLCSGLILIFIFSLDYISPAQELSTKDISSSFSKLFENVGLVHKSFLSTIFSLVKYFCVWQNLDWNLNLVRLTLKYIFYSLFGFFYFWQLISPSTKIINNIVLVLFVFLVFTYGKFHSWYLLNLVLLLPLLSEGILKKLLIALSMSHTFAITFLDQAKILNFTCMTLIPLFIIFLKEKRRK